MKTHVPTSCIASILFFAFFFLFSPGQSQCQWIASYGPGYLNTVKLTSDGGYIVGGKKGNHINGGWIAKLASNGAIEWQRTYDKREGGLMICFFNTCGIAPEWWTDSVSTIEQTADGGYIGGVNVRRNAKDKWVGIREVFGGSMAMKLDNKGKVIWAKPYRISGPYRPSGPTLERRQLFFQQTDDAGYIMAGGVASLVIQKLTEEGKPDWVKSYPVDVPMNSHTEVATSVQKTSDGGYIVAAEINSEPRGIIMAWILKLGFDGSIEWQKIFNGEYNENITSIRETMDGGYVMAGYKELISGGAIDAWVLKLRHDGTVEWQKTYGGAGYDYAYAIREAPDGGYVVAGSTDSFGAGLSDAWVFKLTGTGTVEWERTYGGVNDDEVVSMESTNDGGYVLAGSTYSLGSGQRQMWVLKLDQNGLIAGCPLGGVSVAVVNDTNIAPVDTEATPAASDPNILKMKPRTLHVNKTKRFPEMLCETLTTSTVCFQHLGE